MVKFDCALKLSIVDFTFTSSGSKDFNIKSISLISYIPEGRVDLVADVAIYFTSSIFSIWLYVNSILETISSRSLCSMFYNL